MSGFEHVVDYTYPSNFDSLERVEGWARDIWKELSEAQHGFAEDLELSLSQKWSFKTITGITNDVVADQQEDTLTLATGNATLGIVGTAATDTITWTWAHLGFESLSDPGADRIAFWDDGETAMKWLAPDGTTIEISGTTLQVLAGGLDHGGLTGLGDDDHLQYIKDTEFTQNSGFLVGTGAGTFQEETGATVRTSLGLSIGSDVQAWDADLDTYAGITPSADIQTFLANANFAAMMADLSGTPTAAFAWNSQNLTGVGTIGCGAITSTSTITMGDGTTAEGLTILAGSDNNEGAYVLGKKSGVNKWVIGSDSSITGGVGDNLGIYVYGSNAIKFNIGSINIASMTSTALEIAGVLRAWKNTACYFDYQSYSSTAVYTSPTQFLSRARGTNASPADVAVDDVLGHLTFRGYKNAAFRPAGAIGGFVTGLGADTIDGRISISTMNAGVETQVLELDSDKNVGIGTYVFGTNSERVLAQITGVAPTTSPADAFQMYSKDIVAGNAAPHFRTENDTIIKLDQAIDTSASPAFNGLTLNGALVLAGSGKVTKAAWLPFNALKAPGTKPATFKEWGISGVWEFSDDADDTIVANLKFPYDMDKTVAPIISVGWSTHTAVTSETATWQLEYLYTAPGEDTTANAQATISVDSNAIGQADGLIVVEFPAMAVPGSTDVCIHIRIKRLGAGGNDDLTDTAELHGLCMAYTSDKLGA